MEKRGMSGESWRSTMAETTKQNEERILEKFRGLSPREREQFLEFLDSLVSRKKTKRSMEFEESILNVPGQESFSHLPDWWGLLVYSITLRPVPQTSSHLATSPSFHYSFFSCILTPASRNRSIVPLRGTRSSRNSRIRVQGSGIRDQQWLFFSWILNPGFWLLTPCF